MASRKQVSRSTKKAKNPWITASDTKIFYEGMNKTWNQSKSRENLKFADSEHKINTHLQIGIENFRTAAKSGCYMQMEQSVQYYPDAEVTVSVSVWPDGPDEGTKGWLLVLPKVKLYTYDSLHRHNGVYSCTVNVIDKEGNPTYSHCFEGDFYKTDDEDLGNVKYLKRSAILDREDELLSEGVLTLRCDFSYNVPFLSDTRRMTEICGDFACSTARRMERCIPYSKEKEGYKVTLYDFTTQNLSLAKKRFLVEGIPPVVSLLKPESKADRDILEHVWIFDHGRVKFLLCFDEQQDSIGSRLLKASPVIRRMVNTDMKEQREKRIEIQTFRIETFLLVLFFLETRILPTLDMFYHHLANELEAFRHQNFGKPDFLDVYHFSHFYQMEELQIKCAEALVKSQEFSNEELREIADSQLDEYLSKLLEARHLDDENLEPQRLEMDERPDSQCYI